MSTIFRLVLCLLLLTTVMASTNIDSSLLQVLNGGQTSRLMVSFVEGTEEINKSFENREFPSREDRFTLDRELTALTTRDQAAAVRVLESAKHRIPITYESFWMSNQILVNGADLQLANDIAAVENVSKVSGGQFVKLH